MNIRWVFLIQTIEKIFFHFCFLTVPLSGRKRGLYVVIQTEDLGNWSHRGKVWVSVPYKFLNLSLIKSRFLVSLQRKYGSFVWCSDITVIENCFFLFCSFWENFRHLYCVNGKVSRLSGLLDRHHNNFW